MFNRLWPVLVILAGIIYPGLFCDSVAAFGPEAEKRAILVLLDRVTLDDIRAYSGPVLSDLLERSAVGLMNTRAAKPGPESSYLSLGTGSRASAGWRARLSFNREEKYEGCESGKIYLRHTGVVPEAEIFNPFIPEIGFENVVLKHEVEPGALGEALRRSGRGVAVFGNADTDVLSRPAVLVAMDASGQVPYGDVGEGTLRSDPLFPYGKRTDGENMAREALGALGYASLVVVDWGDTARLDEYRDRLAGPRRNEIMQGIFAELDLFLQPVSSLIGPSTLLLIGSPSPPRDKAAGGEQLLPLIAVGGGYRPGLLTSPTTRRPGLVANMDLAATILQHLEIPRPAPVGGKVMTSIFHADPVLFLSNMSQRVARIYEQRPPLLRGYLSMQIVIVLGGLAGLFLRPSWTKKIPARFLEASTVAPIIFLYLPLHPAFPAQTFPTTAAMLVTAILAVYGIFTLLKFSAQGRFLFWTAVGLFTSLGIAADLLNSASLQKFSFLGYDPVAGSRYYGVGNEYMGVMIGATFLGSAALLEFWNRRYNSPAVNENHTASLAVKLMVVPVCLYYLVVLYLFASPSYGANVGGTLSVAVAAGVAAVGILRISGFICFKKNRSLIFPVVIISIIFLTGVFWVWNFKFNPDEHWHLQTFWEQWRAGGWQGVQGVIQRKVEMNLKLIRYSVWTRALLVFLGLLILLFFYPVGIMKKYLKEERFMFAGIIAVAAGSVTALLINDSGVVAAAAALLFAAPPLMTYFLEETGGHHN